MSTSTTNPRQLEYARGGDQEANASGVSWSAVVAGAFSAAAMSLILLALGAGLGLSSVSPWSNEGTSASVIGVSAIVWLIVTEALSSSLGGYLAGRLRTKWATVHTDEVYFRDTAHGFLAWCVALVLTVAFLTTGASMMLGHPTPTREAKTQSSPNAYFVDSLFRGEGTATEAVTPAVHEEAAIIFASSLAQGSMAAGDQAYLSKIVAAKTGLSAGDSVKRVSDTFTQTQQAADITRKALAHTLLWTFLALLIGAFCGSFSATLGGRQRDNVTIL